MPAIVTVERAEVRESGGGRIRVALAPGRACSRPILSLSEQWLGGAAERPEHGVVAVTLVLDGRVDGAERLEPGDVQWATAGRGLVLREAPIDGSAHCLQLVVDLPDPVRACAPSVEALRADAIPVIDHGSARVRIVAGSHAGVRGPARCPTPVSLLDITIEPRGGGCTVSAACVRGLAYVIAGEAGIAGAAVRCGEVALLDVRGTVPIDIDASGGARLVVVTAPPLYALPE
jgi:quercetin 2,3-dioxygenase